MLIGAITDWRWEIAAYISGDSESYRPKNRFYFFQWFYVFMRLALAIMGLIVQTLTCFHRDRLDQSIVEGNNGSYAVQCNETSEVFSTFVISGIIISVVLICLLLAKFKWQLCRSLKLTDEDIKSLFDVINLRKPGKYVTQVFPILFSCYMIVSLVASIANLAAFHIADDDDVIIHSEINNISGSSKKP